MAGSWIKFETSTSDKPEVWEIANKLDIDPDAVVGKLLRVWTWFDEQTNAGTNAPCVSRALLDRRVSVSGFVSAMIEVGWMVEVNGTLSLPNFERHNGETAKKRALTAKRVAKHGKTNASSVRVSVSSALPREEKRREEKNNTHTHSDSEFVPHLLDTAEFRQQWDRWKDHRIEKYKPLGTIEAESQLGDLLRFGPTEAAAVVDFSIRQGAVNLITNGDHNRKPSTNTASGSRHGRSRVSLDEGLLQ